MKNFLESVGIDISKDTIDVALHLGQQYRQFKNSPSGFRTMTSWVKSLRVHPGSTLFCFEHTGWYCLELCWFLEDRELPFHCAHALQLKRSLGLRRGKSDKTDAYDIARYAWVNREEIPLSHAPARRLVELQRMLSLREQLVKQSTAMKNQEHAMRLLVKGVTNDPSMAIIRETIVFLKGQLEAIEKQLEALVEATPEFASNYALLKGIKGIGLVLALELVVHTHNFTRFATWRQFSSYCGLAPFPYQSGTSIHRKPKTHPICDKRMKSLLSMAAMSTIRSDPEMKLYFKRRVDEGKNKMSVINIIRNKLVARAFAVVKRQTPFVELGKFAA